MKRKIILKVLLIILLAINFAYNEKNASMNSEDPKQNDSIYTIDYDDKTDRMLALLFLNNANYPEKPFKVFGIAMFYENRGQILLSPDSITMMVAYPIDENSELDDQLSILIDDVVYEIGQPNKKLLNQVYEWNVGISSKTIRNELFYEIDHYIIYKLSISNQATILLNGSKINLYENQLNYIKEFLGLAGTKANN